MTGLIVTKITFVESNFSISLKTSILCETGSIKKLESRRTVKDN
jgi:hypothetical protein